jgi:hypothetical protein
MREAHARGLTIGESWSHKEAGSFSVLDTVPRVMLAYGILLEFEKRHVATTSQK